MKLFDIYSWLLSSWLNGGAFARAGRLQSTSIDAQYNVIFTKTHVKQVYRITGIKPENADVAFVDYLRSRMFEMHPNVEIVVNEICHPIHLNVNDDKFNRAFQRAASSYSDYKEAFESQTGIARLTGKTYRLPGGGRLKLSRERLDDLNQVYQSYLYLFNHMSTGGTISLVNIFIEVIGQDIRDVRRAGNDLYGIFGSLNIGVELVKSANKAYMLEMGPAVGIPMTKLNKKFLPQLLFTDENSAAFTTYKSRGLVGNSGSHSILMGLDFRSRLPFSIDPFRSGNAQVFMVLGKTGSGKTYSCFQIATSLLAIGCHISAIDIKGREWSQIAGVTATKIISFDARNQSFVNTLRLDDMLIDGMSPVEAFNTAVNGTVQLMMLLVNLSPGEGNESDAELVIREAVMKMYSLKSVDPSNPSSFLRTRHMKYAEILPILEDLATTNSYTDEQKYMIKLSRSRLMNYFGISGLFADAFRNEISLGDVLSSKFVIYEFNKNSGTMESSLDTLRIFMVQFLDTKKLSVLKLQNKFMGCFYEELQRCEQFGNLLTFICHQVTGARSNNALIFLLLNSLKVLQGKEGQDIRSNITSFVCGYAEDNDIDFIEESMGKPWIAHQLRLFSAKQQIYRNCFVCQVDTGREVFETVYKVELPKDISRRFRTRTILED